MHDNIFESVRRGLFAGVAGAIRTLYHYHKTGEIHLLKGITRIIIGSTLSASFSFFIHDGYSIMGLEFTQSAAITGFVIGFMGVELLEFLLTRDINRFLSIFTPKK